MAENDSRKETIHRSSFADELAIAQSVFRRQAMPT
jgi:hypothetical protein